MSYKSDSDYDSDASAINKSIQRRLPTFNDRSEEDTKFRSFSFPNVQQISEQDTSSGSVLSSPLKNKTSSMGVPKIMEREKDIYLEESHGEALFNHLTNYCFSSSTTDKVSPQTSPVASIFRRRNRAFSSTMSPRKAVLKSGTSRYSFSSQGSDVLSPTACDKNTHSQTLTVSSDEEAVASLKDSPGEYVYRSPKETIRDTFEQIERNSRGSFKSLIDFAEKNNLDTRGKIFANCAETGDIAEPQIDLSIARPIEEDHKDEDEVEVNDEHDNDNDNDDPFELCREEIRTEPWDELSFITYPHRLFG